MPILLSPSGAIRLRSSGTSQGAVHLGTTGDGCCCGGCPISDTCNECCDSITVTVVFAAGFSDECPGGGTYTEELIRDPDTCTWIGTNFTIRASASDCNWVMDSEICPAIGDRAPYVLTVHAPDGPCPPEGDWSIPGVTITVTCTP